jgi:hypothetical protein
MGFLWMAFAAGAVLLWAISLGRIFTFPAPTCVPPSPPFLPPLRGDRRSRNVLLVVAHPDDESMYFVSLLPLHSHPVEGLFGKWRILSGWKRIEGDFGKF